MNKKCRKERLRERLLAQQQELESSLDCYNRTFPLFPYWLKRRRVGDGRLYKLFKVYREKSRRLKSVTAQLKEVSQ